jgi:hypothetical protein
MAKVQTAPKAPKMKAPKTKLCARDKWIRTLDRFQSRIRTRSAKLTSNAEVSVQLAAAADALNAATTVLAALPADWRAREGRGGRGPGAGNSAIVEGSIVDVRAAKKTELADLFDEGEMVGLVVEKIAGSRLKLRSSTGATLLLPRGFFTAHKE